MDLRSSRIEADAAKTNDFDGERARLAHRREQLGLPPLERDPGGVAALALSGGGIRSATLSFGVLEALATSPAFGTPASGPRAPPLLAMFDYLSTVSGGGYIGAFFCSLFLPNRLRSGTTALQAAADAFETCAYVPPERLRATDRLSSHSVGKCPTAWLRENGRYLTPTGAGDGLYAAATAVRNWLAIHYVLGTLFVVVFGLLALVRASLAHLWPWYAGLEESALRHAAPLWWSPVWYLVLLAVVLWLAPSGIAFWLGYPEKNQTDSDPPSILGRAAQGGIAIAIVLLIPLVMRNLLHSTERSQAIYWVPALMGAVSLLAFAMYAILATQSDSITDLRVKMTRLSAKGIAWALGLAVIAAADTLGQSLYLALTDKALLKLTPAAVLAAIVWIIRKVAAATDGGSKSTSILKKLPLNLISGVVGGLMLLLIGCLWCALVQFFDWQGADPDSVKFTASSHLWILLLLLLVSFFMAWTAGQFSAFINLSTLQAVYSARLTRAYLGASNGDRFSADSQQTYRAALSVAEPLPSDQISYKDYYNPESLAPFHIINATVNQTVDPAEQLVQRDRKGRPLAILPCGFTIDGTRYQFKDAPGQSLSIGQWIGVSGAAVTTGLGRATSVGTSLALGLANVRLGLWWTSGYGMNKSQGLERLFNSYLRMQAFFLYELMARFYGLSREWQYLSDGGHFENTGAYELLRPGRGVRFIVACDNGCDPNYLFGDIANLIRLARIDFQLEIEVDLGISADPKLGKVFGTLQDFQSKAGADDKCAILLNVFEGANPASRQPLARIVVLKPRVIAASSIDICEYQSTHVDFPQQSTADQFFDEAQWESYRDLGYRIAKRVFGRNDEQGCGPELAAYLNRQRLI